LGRKTGRGFFVYPAEKGAKPTPNADVLGRFGASDAEIPPDAIADRCLLPMANEAARVMQDGVSDSVDAIDLACVTGLGMAGWRGGIVRYVLDTGVSTVVSRLQALAAKHGDHLNPSEHLWMMAEAGKV
jgi:3-hydroxyacyl-CoA dehydrogenase/enoyl-CoA hydratase/3-hydroxybutyryl-CoA epimerase